MDELKKRMIRLATQADIPDLRAYAEAWNKLGADFEAAGMPANAEVCFRHYRRYMPKPKEHPSYAWRYFPSECDHERLETKFGADHRPVLVTCKDCGAIRFMRISATKTMRHVPAEHKEQE